MRTLVLLLAVAGCPAPQAAPDPAEPVAEPPATAATATEAPAAADAPTPSVATGGMPAPDFTLPDLDGTTHSLSAHRGKVVVLEWFNPGCPFVVAAHEDGPLKKMASTWSDKDVVWMAINSGAPGQQGHGVEVNREAASSWGIDHPILLDEDGEVGRAYGARTTPHMYVVDPNGTLVYAGALDNAPRNAVPKVGYTGFTEKALTAVTAGEPVQASQIQPWGCSVKYGS